MKTDYILNYSQVAEITGYSKRTVSGNWRKMKGFPQPKRIGVKLLKWSKSEVEKFAKGVETA